MLYEFQDVRQRPEEGIRRWFLDDYFDLIIWYDNEKQIIGFQLCYDKNFNERALTWFKEGSYSHTKVDSGDLPYHIKGTPILTADGAFDSRQIAEKFKAASGQIEPPIAHLVYKKLLAYK